MKPVEFRFWDKKYKTFLPPEKVTLNGKGQITMIEGDASIETDDIAVCQFKSNSISDCYNSYENPELLEVSA